LEPVAAPRGRGPGHRVVLERLRRIARYREEAPRELAGARVEGGDVAADAVFAAAHADQHAALHDARCLRDGERMVAVRNGHAPHGLAAACIERDEACVEGADVDPALPG